MSIIKSFLSLFRSKPEAPKAPAPVFTSTFNVSEPAAPVVGAKDLTLQANLEEVVIPYSELAGRTIEQLVEDYADELGIDADAISSYKINRVSVAAATVPQSGDLVSLYVTSESKGVEVEAAVLAIIK